MAKQSGYLQKLAAQQAVRDEKTRRFTLQQCKEMRRKLKTFRRWMAEGRMTEEDIRTAYESWRGHMRRGNSYRVLRRMDRFYKRLMEKGA